MCSSDCIVFDESADDASDGEKGTSWIGVFAEKPDEEEEEEADAELELALP